MQHRLLAALTWALGVAGAVGSFSCYSDDAPTDVRRRPFSCEEMTTCGTCTPVLGCGWCQSGTKGICVSDPHRCAGAETFTWTWEAAFCPGATDGGADASVSDAGTNASWPDATAPSDAEPSADGSASADASTDAAAGDAAHE